MYSATCGFASKSTTTVLSTNIKGVNSIQNVSELKYYIVKLVDKNNIQEDKITTQENKIVIQDKNKSIRLSFICQSLN